MPPPLAALAVSLVPLGALAALGGAYGSSTLPILAGAAAAFFAAGARVGGRGTRALDAALVALVAGVAVQLLPLPGVVDLLSPHLHALRSTLDVDPASSPATLSVDPRLTRAGLASLVSAVLVFWAARDAFGRGGVRVAARAVAWAGLAVTLVAFAQRATAPGLLLWTWTPGDPEAQPLGPFLNRNHFATWLLMAAALTTGHLVSHTRSLLRRQTALRLRVRDWLADGHGLVLLGAALVMLLATIATQSRAAILGAGAALAAGAAMSRDARRGRAVRLAAAAVALLMAFGVWTNRDGLARKFGASATAGRVTIWRETIPVVRDFWMTGTGVGTYGPTMLRYQQTRREVHFNQAHSEYLQVAAEGGLLVVVPLLAAIAAAVRLARHRLRGDRGATAWLRVGAAAGLAGIAVQGVFETGLRVPANGLLAALLAAVVVYAPDRISRPAASEARR